MAVAAAASYYTWDSLQTLAIATGAVVVVSNTARMLLKIDSPWIPFVVSLALAIAGAVSGGNFASVSDIVLTLLNACLLFCTATGANKTLVKVRAATMASHASGGGARWLSDWM